MTDVRFALGGSLYEPFGSRPEAKFLVSYAYINEITSLRKVTASPDWVLDSGAYTAFKSGKPIKLDSFIAFCKDILDKPNPPTEIFALDVIGDWKASLRNVEKMWAKGVEAIPTYHAGEPEDYLLGIARDYPKIAVGGAAGRIRSKEGRIKFTEQCFARIWPCRVHGFGVGNFDQIMSVPWHSVDHTTWANPRRFGSYKSLGRPKGRGNETVQKPSLDRSKMSIAPEIDYYLNYQKKAKAKWRKQLELLKDLS